MQHAIILDSQNINKFIFSLDFTESDRLSTCIWRHLFPERRSLYYLGVQIMIIFTLDVQR